MNHRRSDGFIATEIWKILLVTLIYQTHYIRSTVPCELLYGGCKHNIKTRYPPAFTLTDNAEPAQPHQWTYVPSPPGKHPRCAKPGLTFCEKIEKYPADLITTLAAKTNYNFKSLFADESDGARKGSQRNYNTGFHQGTNYGTPTANGYTTMNGFNQSSPHGGYPDRQYPLDEESIHFVDPVLYASFSNVNSAHNQDELWRRSERSGSQKGHERKRRQSQPSTPAGNELCPTRSQFIMPRAALNNRGEWKYVVNVEGGSARYTQLVRSEICLTTECNDICSIPNGYTSRCEQKYVQKRLVALEGTGSSLYTDIFWFPHCCVCQIAPDIR